ncbi:MAG: ABC transporter [Tessaracoccus sp.]|uniref:ABC transporter n=1 Tax=Tessaracoccus sp. TaxID=1971211 RepID=UPI001EC7969A|nr:ABC transporter [Tessaracoccus sp.]MBK7820927.1 ABC transporter [Tessaracoccus sp.]
MTGAERLAAAFNTLQDALPAAQYPLPIEGADGLRQLVGGLTQQTRDYLIPRAASLDAPLLAVVGGSTGAGKSTLVNSLLRAQVTRPGVLRPTTKSPVLICHPADEAWFRSDRVLPALVRTEAQLHDSRALHIMAFDGLPPGLALLDAPDIDSIDDDNRSLARQLLLAADLWLFVTSAARYADAVPWEYLSEAAHRNTVISVIVNRCPPSALVEVSGHLSQMLAERGLAGARLFAVAERALPSDGMLPPDDVSGLKQWLSQLAAESEARSQVAVQSLAGTVRSIDTQLHELIDGVQRQRDALAELRRESVAPYQRAAATVADVAGDGSLLRGEILSRWQDLVGTGEFMRSIEERIGRLRDRLGGWFRGEAKEEAMQAAISDTLTAVLREAGDRAAEETCAAWSLTRWGRDIVAAEPGLQRASSRFHAAAADAVRAWQADVIELVNEQGRGKRMKARFLAIGTNLAGLALIVVVFASTGGLTTAEVGIAGGTSLLAQRLLEAVFGEDAVRRLADLARRRLADRVEGLLADEASRFTTILDALAVDADATDRLESAASALRDGARAAFDDLTAPELG